MADIELVIKIPKKKYQTIIKHTEEILDESSFIEPKYLYRAVLNGTPLPKGHGKLVDEDKLIGKIHGVRSITAVLDAPTIIEADKAESEDIMIKQEKMTKQEIDTMKYIVCCPMCDNEKCVKKTDKCEAEIWAKNKIESEVPDAHTD